MGGLLRFLGGLILVIVAVLLVGFLALRRGDIPLETLKAKYAVPASSYMAMPDGVVVHYRDDNPAAPLAKIITGYPGPAHSTGAARGELPANLAAVTTTCAPGQSSADCVAAGPPGYTPTLVMIHGFSASTRDWDDWIRILGPHYRIISIDLPGHGLTSAPKGYKASIDGYADLIDSVTARLGAQKFVIIGNSMGGGTAWDFALRHPDRLDGLVLVDAVGWARPRGQDSGKGPIIFRIMRSKLGLAVLRQIDVKPLIGQGLRSAFVDEKLVTPALIDRYSDFARAPGHRDILMSIQSGARTPVTEATMATIKVPTLIMHGRQDHLIPFAQGQAFARVIPGSTLIAYDGVGHVPMEQIPDKSAADLDGWLKAKVYTGR
jgi:pimeloyl-ACP methyl ester carboxylesterase